MHDKLLIICYVRTMIPTRFFIKTQNKNWAILNDHTFNGFVTHGINLNILHKCYDFLCFQVHAIIIYINQRARTVIHLNGRDGKLACIIYELHKCITVARVCALDFCGPIDKPRSINYRPTSIINFQII